jgi:hypothetical protein
MVEQQYVEIRRAEKKIFVHFTYVWHEKSIEEGGLNTSIAGQMGKAIYCSDIEDDAAIEKALEFMKEEMCWETLAEYLGLESSDDIDGYFELDRIIIPVFFLYTGSYRLGLAGQPCMDIEGYIAIEAENIPTNFLVVGHRLEDRDIDSQIENLCDMDDQEAFTI